MGIQTGGFNKKARTDLPPMEQRGIDITQLSPEAREAFIRNQERVSAEIVPSNHIDRLKNVLDVKDQHNLNTNIVVSDEMFMPVYQTVGAACADLVANIPSGLVSIPSRTQVMIDCGFSVEIPDGWQGVISLRSSLAMHGLVIPNAPCILDSDFRGQVKVLVSNIGKNIVVINHGDRFAQMQPMPVTKFKFTRVSTLSATDRGEGGFGSTGN